MSNYKEQPPHFSTSQPDAYDRAYGQMDGFPHTRPSTITAGDTMGIGGVRSYIVQTFRPPEMEDSLFIQITGSEGLTRIHLPAKVTRVIARQSNAMQVAADERARKARSLAGKARAAADKAAGIQPGFMRGKKTA
jgi:hypothetical protein|tara:strand:+ start:668 stop:1072 length:405 start_codon:yes stop_codon:yes gene_type:complete